MSSHKLFGPRTVKMECWFCQQVNVLGTIASDRKGKAKEPMFPLEGTKNNFRCQFCGNRNLRDRVSLNNVIALPRSSFSIWHHEGGKNLLKLAGDVRSRFPFSFLDGQYVDLPLWICRSQTNESLFRHFSELFFSSLHTGSDREQPSMPTLSDKSSVATQLQSQLLSGGRRCQSYRLGEHQPRLTSS